MNKQIEEAFVKSYIVPGKRERLLFELHGKKRSVGIDRFCHRTEELIVKSAIKAQGQYILPQLQKEIEACKDQKCYILSIYDDIDGTELSKDRVLDTIIGRGMPSIAVFDRFAIIEAEQEQGPAVKYLLQK